MVPGRSKKVFKTWLASQPDTWRERIEIVAMDGFTGFKSAAAEELPDATTVMDPFHVVHLAGNALDECRRRIQQELHHRRGRATDPLYKARRMLHTRSCLLTARQQYQILDLFSSDEHVALEVTWSVYQNIIDAYRSSNARGGKTLMHEEITRLTSTSVPSSLTELITLGRTLKRRATDILAYFDNPHTTGGPTEAINAPPRTPTRLRPRIPKPHPLHHPSTPRNRRIQTPTTPPIMKSLKNARRHSSAATEEPTHNRETRAGNEATDRSAHQLLGHSTTRTTCACLRFLGLRGGSHSIISFLQHTTPDFAPDSPKHQSTHRRKSLEFQRSGFNV